MAGKGSSPRPFSVDQKTFSNNWDKVFGKNNQEKNPDQQKRDNNERHRQK